MHPKTIPDNEKKSTLKIKLVSSTTSGKYLNSIHFSEYVRVGYGMANEYHIGMIVTRSAWIAHRLVSSDRNRTYRLRQRRQKEHLPYILRCISWSVTMCFLSSARDLRFVCNLQIWLGFNSHRISNNFTRTKKKTIVYRLLLLILF